MNTVITIHHQWPSPEVRLSCPDTPEQCATLVTSQCHEPESETSEIISSFLVGCSKECLYLDIGCNLGYFASQAAALGARAECFEPYPVFAQAANATATLNGFGGRMKVRHAAVTVFPGLPPLSFTSTYHACDIARDPRIMAERGFNPRVWSAPTVTIQSLLHQRTIDFLKIDIDSIEGALLHVATMMIAAGNTTIKTMLIELGDGSGSKTPRGGHVDDLWKLGHELGYDIYRVNIAVNREIYDWSGVDVNTKPSAPSAAEKQAENSGSPLATLVVPSSHTIVGRPDLPVTLKTQRTLLPVRSAP